MRIVILHKSHFYANQQQNQSAGESSAGQSTSGSGDEKKQENVVDAEFEEVKDDKKS